MTVLSLLHFFCKTVLNSAEINENFKSDLFLIFKEKISTFVHSFVLLISGTQIDY